MDLGTLVQTEHPLLRLIDDVDLLGSYWNVKHGLFKQACPTEGLLDENAIQSILDVGLLRWPYFTLVKDGIQPAISAFTKTRYVMGESVRRFADPDKVRELLASGATMKLNQLEDWHLPIRNLMRDIEARIPAELKSYVFYTPKDNTGMLPHRDGSHVLAMQIAGAKEWRIYDGPDQVDARGGLLDIDPESHAHSFVTEPGDVLYLPHGYPHVATARSGTSLHLTLTITEPAPLDLVESLMATLADGLDGLERDQILSPEDKAEAVTKELLSQLQSLDPAVLVETAVGLMRKRVERRSGYR
jgi:ribosomal protein L16 Arg81 hydroxylase